MRPRALLLSVTLLALPLAAKAAPGVEECPYPGAVVYDLDKVEQGLRGAATCEAAVALFERCLMGATSDVVMGGIVIDKCEAAFPATLSRAQKRAYARAQDRCARKFRRHSGSLYRSLEAQCLAEVASAYARRWRKGTPAARRVRP
jgi:hypothetical protein